MKKVIAFMFVSAFFLCMDNVFAQITPSKESLNGLYPGKTYSPYAQRSFPDKVLWGDTHLHTALSLDAGLFGNTLGLDEAYRFSRGEEVISATGLPVRLGRPLDWVVIADHSDLMGFSDDLRRGAPNLLAIEEGKRWYDGMQAGGDKAAQAALELITSFAQGKMPQQMLIDYSPASKVYASVWQRCIETAEKYNEPGHFTALIGYEWTALTAGNNLHRNVIYRDNGDKAARMVPMVTQPPLGSIDELELYKWMEKYESTTGGSVLAIAHNGNLSNGLMFPFESQFTGRKLDAFMWKAGTAGNLPTRSLRSKATVKHILISPRMTNLLIMRPGMWGTWTLQQQRPMTC